MQEAAYNLSLVCHLWSLFFLQKWMFSFAVVMMKDQCCQLFIFFFFFEMKAFFYFVIGRSYIYTLSHTKNINDCTLVESRGGVFICKSKICEISWKLPFWENLWLINEEGIISIWHRKMLHELGTLFRSKLSQSKKIEKIGHFHSHCILVKVLLFLVGT